VQGPAETVGAPGHDDVEPAPGSVLQEPVESRALVTPLSAADAVIDVLLDHLPPGALGDLAQRHELYLRVLMAVAGADTGYNEPLARSFRKVSESHRVPPLVVGMADVSFRFGY
jgi:hypothetical protein